MYKLIICLFLSISLFAEVDYDLVLLAPEGQELEESKRFGLKPGLNESGYAWRSYSKKGLAPFIYHKDFGFKLIPIPLHKYDESTIAAVNNRGVAVGTLSKKGVIYPNYYFERSEETIFVYDSEQENYYDLFETTFDYDSNQREYVKRFVHFNIDEENYGMKDYFLNGSYVQHLTITDNQEIIFRRNNDLRTFIYNLDTKTVTIFNNRYIYEVNAKGQMIGGDTAYNQDANEVWFFDAKTLHSLGPVVPIALAQNGLVAGKDKVSTRDNKIFIWDLKSGLNKMDPPSNNFDIHAINDHREVIGSFGFASSEEYYYHAFILSPTLGLLDLGALGPDEDSHPHAINNQGQVVGDSGDRENKKAYIWDIQHGMRDLTSLIPKSSGWKKLTDANSINNAGQIVGRGEYFGVEQYFLLIPKSE